MLSLALVLSSLGCPGLKASAEEGQAVVTAAATTSGGDSTASGGDPTISGGEPTAAPTATPTTAPTATPTAAPTGTPTVSGGEPTAAPTATPIVKTPLDTPIGIEWGSNYSSNYNKYQMICRMVADCKSYSFQIYKDGSLYGTKNMGVSNPRPGVSIGNPSFAFEIKESGTYKFRVKARIANDDKIHTDSEWSDWSEEKVYVRPDRQVGTTKAYWDTTEAGVVHFAAVDNAEWYDITLYYNGRKKSGVTTKATADEGQMLKYDWSKKVAEYGAGKYTVQIKAISANLDEYANGEPGEMSDVYDTTVTAEQLSGALSEAMADTSKTPAEVKETLKASADISAVQTAMQTDEAFRGQVEALEAKYAAEQGITAGRDVSEAAKEYVDPSQVKMVGAALNASAGESVQLDMDLTPEENKVPLHANYLNSVQLDIKLTRGSDAVHTLEVPISITMPVPKGIAAAQLVILHYHQDGTVERAAFHVNGDGTITFTVRAFSTFVFAAEKSGDGDNSGDDDNTGSGDNSGDGDNTGSGDNSGDGDNTGNGDNSGDGDNTGSSDDSEDEDDDEEEAQPQPAQTATYVVARGDNLSKIAAKHGVSLFQLIAWNPQIKNPSLIYAGQVIVVEMRAGTQTAAPAVSAAPTAGTAAAYYTVQKGDSLYQIARAQKVSMAQLSSLNPEAFKQKYIYPGQKIRTK